MFALIDPVPDPVPMTEKHKTIIKSHLEQLENLNAECVMKSCVAKDIITLDEREGINKENATSTRKASALLTLLVRKQDQAFYVLMDALKDCASPELARILERAGRLH